MLFRSGQDYEYFFDQLEVILALVYIDRAKDQGDHIWAPPGRFAWKHSSNPDGSPYTKFKTEALDGGQAGPLVSAGLFRGSTERLDEVIGKFDDFLMRVRSNFW